MCFDGKSIGGIARWNWDGDAVVFDTAVPSMRPVVGGKRRYTIDVREFVLPATNAVVRHTIKEGLRPFAATLKRGGADLFEARHAGAFDFRVKVIEAWVGANIRYAKKDGRDPWQFADETLTMKAGDCEDIAFVIASLMLGAGISGYHVRVAIGEVRVGDTERYDHAWVMYKNEAGRWQLIEPLRNLAGRATQARVGRNTARRSARRGTAKMLRGPVRYVPSFLFNDEHLWIVTRHGNPGSIDRIARRRWNRMKPTFAGEVHLSILDRALGDVAPPSFLSALHDRFSRLALVGPLIDADDWVNVLNPSSTPYDPRQHFDNGLISESWDLLENHAASFRADRNDADAFGHAAHAIADFYAHSSYLAFAWVSGASPRAKPFHPDAWSDDDHLHDAPFYGPGPTPELGRFDFHRFTINPALWRGSIDQAIVQWDGRIITGRYAQSSDDRHGSVVSKLAEAMSSLPNKYKRPEIGALPHHAEIAVDDADWTASHVLFEPAAFAMQYQWRINTAVGHVRQLWDTGVP